MKKYELLIFDFDGTLVDTIADIAFYANKTLACYGYARQTPKKIQAAVGWGVHELLKKLAPGIGSDKTRLEEAVHFFKKSYFAAPIRATRAYESVPETLRGPLKNVKKAVLTNKPQAITIEILKKLKLHSCFETVIGIDGGFPPKPDPKAAAHLLKTLSVRPRKTMLIGDSPVDFETSKKARIDFGWVDYGYHGKLKEKPFMRFSGAAEWAGLAD